MKGVFCSILLLGVLLSPPSFAQVTFGSSLKPSDGSILDLKENESSLPGGATASRGLGLPKVRLAHPHTLRPTVELATEIEEKMHEGLVVYHITDDKNPACASMKHGLYVWDGKEWNALFPKTNAAASVSTLVDDRGDGDVNTYFTRSFGAAGVWMLEHIRAKKYDERTDPIDIIKEPLPAISSYEDTPLLPKWGYPNKKGETDASKDQYFLENTKLGLLYNYAAATNSFGSDIPPHLIESMGVDPHENIQGICPKNWHVPSDYEWTLLEEEMTKNTHLYTNRATAIDPSGSTLPFSTTIDPSTDGRRGEHGYSFKSQCAPPYPSEAAGDLDQYGTSLSAEEGGFAVEFAGGIKDGEVKYDDSHTYFWSSSLDTDPRAFRRGIFGTKQPYPAVSRYSLDKKWYFSVRCVKD